MSKRTYLTLSYRGKLHLFCSYREIARFALRYGITIEDNSIGSIRAVSRLAARLAYADSVKPNLGPTTKTIPSHLLNLRSHGAEIAWRARMQSNAVTDYARRAVQGLNGVRGFNSLAAKFNNLKIAGDKE